MQILNLNLHDYIYFDITSPCREFLIDQYKTKQLSFQNTVLAILILTFILIWFETLSILTGNLTHCLKLFENL